jgi:hypothetical protein
LVVCPALLLGDDRETLDLGGGDDERVRPIAILGGLHQERVPRENVAGCALDGVIERYEHMRARVDPPSELVLLSRQLDAHLVGAEHLLLGDEFVQLDPQSGEDIGWVGA